MLLSLPENQFRSLCRSFGRSPFPHGEHGMKKITIFILSIICVSIIFSFLTTPASAEHGVFHGRVVGTEFFVVQVKGDNGKVSAFWLGHKTYFDSRVPFFGDRVRIEYVKDKLGRNAVTRITILGRK